MGLASFLGRPKPHRRSTRSADGTHDGQPRVLNARRVDGLIGPAAAHLPPVAVTLLLLAIVAAIWVRSGPRVSWASLLVWVVALGWAVADTRTVAVAAAMAAPLVVAVVSSALTPEASESRPQTVRRRRVEWITLVASIVIRGVLAAVVLPATTGTPDRMPTGLDAALDRLPAGTVVFNEYWVGGYLGVQGTRISPVIDQRTEVFTVDYVQAHLAARGAKPGWADFVKRTRLRPPRESEDRVGRTVVPRNLRRRSSSKPAPVRYLPGHAHPSGKSRLATTRCQTGPRRAGRRGLCGPCTESPGSADRPGAGRHGGLLRRVRRGTWRIGQLRDRRRPARRGGPIRGLHGARHHAGRRQRGDPPAAGRRGSARSRRWTRRSR